MKNLKEIDEYNFGATDDAFIRKNVFRACLNVKTAIDLFCYGHHGGVCNFIFNDNPLMIIFNNLKELDEKLCEKNKDFEKFPEFFELKLPEDQKRIQGESGISGVDSEFKIFNEQSETLQNKIQHLMKEYLSCELSVTEWAEITEKIRYLILYTEGHLDKSNRHPKYVEYNARLVSQLYYDKTSNNDINSELKERVKRFELLHKKYVISLIQKISMDNNDNVMMGDLETLKELILKYKVCNIEDDADYQIIKHLKERIWIIRMIHPQSLGKVSEIESLKVHFFRITHPKIPMNLYLLSCLMRDIVESEFKNTKFHENYCFCEELYYFLENGGYRVSIEQVNNAINSNVNIIEKFLSKPRNLDVTLCNYFNRLLLEYKYYQKIH